MKNFFRKASILILFVFLIMPISEVLSVKAASSQTPNGANIISDIQIEPDPYNPAIGPATFQFSSSESSQGKTFNALILGQNGIVTGWVDKIPERGKNILIWHGELLNSLKDGQYTFRISLWDGNKELESYGVNFTVDRKT